MKGKCLGTSERIYPGLVRNHGGFGSILQVISDGSCLQLGRQLLRRVTEPSIRKGNP